MTNAMNGGEKDNKRKFTSWKDHYEGDGCTEKCNWCITRLGRLGHGHIEPNCRQKDPSKYPLTHPAYKARGTFVPGEYIPKKKSDDDTKKYVTINDIKSEPGEHADKRVKKAALIAMVFMTRNDENKNKWQYDTAANVHVCNNRQSFGDDYNDDDKMLQYIYTCAGYIKPKGVGTVKINTFLTNGSLCELTLKGVYHIPNCPVNLLSGTKVLLGGYYHHAPTSALRSMDGDEELCALKFDTDHEQLLLKLDSPSINQPVKQEEGNGGRS